MAYGSHLINRRAPFIIGGAVLAIIGYIILITSSSTGVQYFATFLCAGGIYPATAIALSWPANNVSGQLKRAVACALQISVGNVSAPFDQQIHEALTNKMYRVSVLLSVPSYTDTALASTSGMGLLSVTSFSSVRRLHSTGASSRGETRRRSG